MVANEKYLCLTWAWVAGAGLVLMQLAVPKLRSASALRTFNKQLQDLRCDLGEWRARERLPAAQTAALDANDGAGWDLAQALLRPRKLEVRCSSLHFLGSRMHRGGLPLTWCAKAVVKRQT